MDGNAHSYQIYYTNSSAWFVIDDFIIHKFSGTINPLSANLSLKASSECWNYNGNNNSNSLQVRVASINRLGKMVSQPILKNISGPATQILKYGAGNLHRVMVCSAGATGAICAVYDSLYPSATTSWGTLNVGVGSSPAISGQGNFVYDYTGAPFSTGLTVVTTGSSSINVIYE